ncbi:hypothetical protein QJS10_CPA10g01259 [Acorus calamus]|uniref:Uncharacterized protein n=1 Tax=Acorus calamus TaxID=4465 RepID=A0AAV9DYF1_ACOCL|nr:hypothetical protein QJS10_CPA10g01259 [Acorus calamus]
MHRSRVQEKQGERHETGWKAMFTAGDPRVWTGNHRMRLPLDCSDHRYLLRQHPVFDKEQTGGSGTAMSMGLLLLSWLSFGLAIILLGASSSMNRRQPYGKGWLDGNCYIVNNGVYTRAAVLVVVTMIFILGFTRLMRTAAVNHVMQDGQDHMEGS